MVFSNGKRANISCHPAYIQYYICHVFPNFGILSKIYNMKQFENTKKKKKKNTADALTPFATKPRLMFYLIRLD